METFIPSIDSRRIAFDPPILVAHQPEFLPWLGFVSKATMGDVYIILDSVQFRKRYFQHRNKIRIKSEQGWMWLILPLNRASIKEGDKIISKIEIIGGNWPEEHLRAIKLSYANSPYFQEIYDDLCNIYAKPESKLTDFNTEIIKYAFKKFDIKIPVLRTSDLINSGYKIKGQKTELILSMCHAVGAKTFVSGPFGKTYLDFDAFKKDNISLVFHSFDHPKYTQIHGSFIPYMSFIDLLFNHGTDSIELLGKPGWDLVV